jgi:hypothetical protein
MTGLFYIKPWFNKDHKRLAHAFVYSAVLTLWQRIRLSFYRWRTGRP